MSCPHCGETSPDVLELLDNGMRYCRGCDHASPAPDPPRLIDPRPTDEQRRRDLNG